MNTDEIKILIGMHSHGMIHVETAFCLVNAVAPIPYKKKLAIEKNAYCQYGKNKLAAKAITEQFTHLVIIDGDMVFPEDGIMRLIESDKDCIGGLYYRRQTKVSPLIALYDEQKRLYTPSEFPKDMPFRVVSTGGGFICVKTKVLEDIGEPWFWVDMYNGELLGDDVHLCKKITDAGYEVWCDPTIQLHHIGDFPF